MKAIWLEANEVSIRDIPTPVPAEGEALIAVSLAGICATDLELIKGYYPFTGVIGHEFVGTVLQARGRADLEGERVVGEINAVCGHCQTCLRGDRTHCENRNVLGIVNRNGAFAEALTLPIENLHQVPDGVQDEAAVFTEPLAAALEILDQLEIGPREHVLLVGAGRLGQLIARTLQLTDCDLTVIARHPNQQALLELAGIRWVSQEESLQRGFDIVVEATGSKSGFETARALVRPRGTIVLKSTYKGAISVDFSSIVVDEIRLIGSRCGPFEKAVELLSSGQVDPLPLVQARYSLEQGLLAIDKAREPGGMKIIIEN